ncbi:histidine kinase [Streptomyces sp. HNM0645]|uniref:sensor histidine kinase n=1 Tax=Streptomyces sp. HNM0645 TaxID=2782343 RepID=UPI0024B7EF89|nr:histidine kinase [Streptomyces sp. HNM0645]MDI9884934.1 histidine kinase [Streptomyces sp. HNM0645]
MSRFIRLLFRSVTYTRWLHLCIPVLVYAVWLFTFPSGPMVLVPFLFPLLLGLVPSVRTAEGLQARLMLVREERDAPHPSITVGPATSWTDRLRTVLWLETRAVLAVATAFATVRLPLLAVDLVRVAGGSAPGEDFLSPVTGPRWLYGALAPLPLLALPVVIMGLGGLVTAVARRLLGPSAAERLAALEARTELLLEHNRIARELHDSIGHALTIVVVQAGAARAAGDGEFTARALAAIEETGRAAMDDLERVLTVLRASGGRNGPRPTLGEADHLLESARASGAPVDAVISGALDTVPGPVSREGYRILQEALTNVLRHCGPVPVQVNVTVVDRSLEMEVTNPLSATISRTRGGSGLRGIHERAALLGGEARSGPHEEGWKVRVQLPLDGIR